jgi:predicted neuraminidase
MNHRSCRFSCTTQLFALCFLADFVSADAPASDDLLNQRGVVASEFIFEQAPFQQCHASTIVETSDGLVAAWFGGPHERDPNIGIWLSRHIDGHWTAPAEVANGIQYWRPDSSAMRFACWNPVLFLPKSGPLLLFYKCGPEQKAWWGMLTTSTDNGASWSPPRRLPEGILGPVKNKPVQLDDGAIVCPSSTERDGWRLHLEITRDLGATWTLIGPINDGQTKGAIQPSILFHRDGRWQVLARDHNKQGNVWTTWSSDRGHTWTDLESTGLPNPDSGTDAITLSDGRQLLVYNHARRQNEDEPAALARHLLNVAVSDDGVQWQAALLLDNDEGEHSYPAVIQTRDGLVHITYTWKRERIKHVIVDPAKFVLRPIRDGQWPD